MRKSLCLVAACSTFLIVGAPTAPAVAVPRMCAGQRVTIVGTPGNDTVRGTARADVIDGLAGSDVINGLAGNDTICGNYGADDLRGNTGKDRVYGGLDAVTVSGENTFKQGDTLRGGPGNDILVPGFDDRPWNDEILDTITYDTAPRGVSVNLSKDEATGDGADRIAVNGPSRLIGSDFGDRLVGTGFYDEILAGHGRDTVYGLESPDLIALDGPASESEQQLSDTAYGGAGDDNLSSGGGGDHVTAGPGNDTVRDYGSRGGDTLEGGDGNDLLDDEGDTIANNLQGQAGNDQVVARLFESNLTLGGGTGTDAVTIILAGGAAPSATLSIPTGIFEVFTSVPVHANLTDFETYAYQGHRWRVDGSAGRDFVDATNATEVHMTGLSADDSLRGSPGNDNYDGGAGTGDCFQRSLTGGGTDTVTNVEQEEDAVDGCPWPF